MQKQSSSPINSPNQNVGVSSNRQNAQQQPAKERIRKRHWALGCMIVLGGSWITHTTTATISSDTQPLTLSLLDVAKVEPKPDQRETLIRELEFNAPFSEPKLEKKVEPIENLTLVSHKVIRGESLGLIFKKRKLDLAIPHNISRHDIASQLVSLSVGKDVTFKFSADDTLKGISYPTSSLQNLEIEFEGTQVKKAFISDRPYSVIERQVSGEINSSLYQAALDAGMSNATVMEMVRIFGWDIDFVLDIRKGDTFHVVHTDYMHEGSKLRDGNILAADFTTQGQTYRAIRFEDSEGISSFYTPEGESMLGTFLRSPVEFSRISSRFGKRKHPISKKWKTHKGTDYAASRGTPVRATADGKVIHAGKKGGYGKTVVLRHAGRFSTLYAHMNGFAKGVRSGGRVKQGQIIGYVGSTGYSTGPHLHYEFRVDGVHRNSLTYKTPKASSIKPELKLQFEALSRQQLAKLDTAQKEYELAQISSERTVL